MKQSEAKREELAKERNFHETEERTQEAKKVPQKILTSKNTDQDSATAELRKFEGQSPSRTFMERYKSFDQGPEQDQLMEPSPEK